MARKDIFANITNVESARPDRKTTPGYATRGASRSMISSLGELAEKAAKADQLLEGETIVDLSPDALDVSFVSDRMEEDEVAFQELVDAIRERGQDSPVLVRPHPTATGRYQVVFGHRRVRAARQLGRSVRAVVKDVADIDHVIAQGQENSARENLSFIEKAVFAQQLLDRGFDRSTIQKSMSVDAPMLTRLLSVSSRIPADISAAIGPAKSIGRDRWLELAQLIERPENRQAASLRSTQPDFRNKSSDARFETVLAELKSVRKSAKPSRAPSTSVWEPDDRAVSAEYKNTGKSFSLSLKARDAGKFGRYLSENLERLYGEFRNNRNSQGD